MSFSVLMSVYYKENPEYFHRALQSIWDDQTFKPDEIVLIKDGPLTNDLNAIIASWQENLDNVFKVIDLPQNVGLGAAMNEGLKFCKYDLVARMDTDDISLPTRFEKQISFMQLHQDVAVVSSWIEEVNDDGDIFFIRKIPSHHNELVKFARKRSPIAHAVAMFRKTAVLSVGGYPVLRKAQDYALWALLLMAGYKLANISESLYQQRITGIWKSSRGIKHLQYELEMLKFQKQIGFISSYVFIRNFSIRCLLRLSPPFFKKILYQCGRRGR